jgi:hypothetical protein
MKKILFLLTFCLTSCGGLRESPVIYFSNASPELIKNIQCNWVNKNVLSLSELTPGDSRSQSFYIKKNSDFFGLITMSWDSASGERLNKSFHFTEKNLPSMADSTTYSYVQIYLDQDDLEIVSSDAPDLGGKTRRMDRVLTAVREQYLHGHAPVGSSSLIRVQPQKDNSLPGWLANSY